MIRFLLLNVLFLINSTFFSLFLYGRFRQKKSSLLSVSYLKEKFNLLERKLPHFKNSLLEIMENKDQMSESEHTLKRTRLVNESEALYRLVREISAEKSKILKRNSSKRKLSKESEEFEKNLDQLKSLLDNFLKGNWTAGIIKSSIK